ncbi:peptidoglycan-binding domain-containing protein [Streptomyces sp. NPDC046261]|uniref:peptidoglycan-binding domain-containing protein n=1 Tax=Streptomyces sp. NPDC046261 TaxID=3157200 RepID=UPI0033D96078
MASQGDVAPHEARDAAEFVALMRRLKERSGLTYRQLEERAADRGEVLARSTLADALRRQALPRSEMLATFVRACGGDHQVDAWLEARDRLAAVPAPPPGRTVAGARASSLPRRARLTALAATALLLLACVWMLILEGSKRSAARPGAPAGNADSSGQPLLSSKACAATLSKGDHNVCVQELQKRLQHHGLDLPADAVFGPYTKMRLAAFQVFAGVPVTAMADDPTKKALYKKSPDIPRWSPEQVERRLREVFPEEPETAVRLVRCLAHLDPLWIWAHRDGNREWGLFQFSDLELRELRAAPATALDPEWSIRRGRAIWERTKDFRHWSCTPRVTAMDDQRG